MCCCKLSSPWPNNETDLSGACTSCFGLHNSFCQHTQAKNLDSFHITFTFQEFRPHCLTTSVSRMSVRRLSECIIDGFVQPTYLHIHLL
jgi:hypothetical protein